MCPIQSAALATVAENLVYHLELLLLLCVVNAGVRSRDQVRRCLLPLLTGIRASAAVPGKKITPAALPLAQQ